MKMLLIHPPLDDPTLPYHSTAYLAGHLRSRGFTDVAMRDINIEYVNHLLTYGTIEKLYGEAEKRLADLSRRATLTYQHQEAYYGLLSADRISPAQIVQSASALRKADTFLDFATYLESVSTLSNYCNFLGTLCYPLENRGFKPVTHGRFSIASIRDLTNRALGDAACWPFTSYFDEKLTTDRQFIESDLYGISIVYDHQLYYSFHFARLLKSRWPSKKVVLGGTAITQLYKYLKDKNKIKELFGLCDAIVVGEGETAIVEIAQGNGDFEQQQYTNTITYSRDQDYLSLPEVRYENVSLLGSPTYDHPWDLYLSPERGINYSPTRGCYWNRCTFCDYGLNTDKPTSPWRERRIEQVIADLQAAQKSQGVKFVYFAVDVMAPGYLERMSDAFLNAGLDMHWAAELRMEKIFSYERAYKMAKAGCVCVSFGMESGSQRVLDLMDKGTKVDYMSATMKNFSNAGIACQLMAFTDFPTETPAEKAATYEFIRNNEEYWATGGLGTFLLTGTSAIAKNPAKFGITLIETADADVGRAVAYRVDNGTGARIRLTEDADASFDDHGGIFPPVLGRPWAGGTDSLHTMIYYHAYGRTFFKNKPPEQVVHRDDMSDEDIVASSIVVNGRLVESSHDFHQILRNRRLFLNHLWDRFTTAREPTFTAFQQWVSTLPPLVIQSQVAYWFVLGNECMKLEKPIYKLLSAVSAGLYRLDEILSNLPDPLQPKFLNYFKMLESNGFISFQIDGQIIKNRVSGLADMVMHRSVKDEPPPPWRIAAHSPGESEVGAVAETNS